MKVFLVRHGRSADREANVRQSSNSPLSQTGKNQAQAVVERLKSEEVNIIYSSPYLRAFQTAEIIGTGLSMPVETNELVRELSRSKMDGVGYKDPLNLEFIRQMKENLYNIDWKFPKDSETFRNVAKRASQFRDFLLATNSHQNVLVVTHGLFISCFIGVCVLGDDFIPETFMRLARSLSIENTSISEIEYFQDNKQWKISLLNDHLHIKNL